MLIISKIAKKNIDTTWQISPYETVFEAIKKLSDHDLGALLVMSDTKILGIFSERDYARKLLLEGRESTETTVQEVMMTDIYSVTPDKTLEECLALMVEKRVRHLPVVSNDGFLIDFVSMRDVVEGVISDKEFLIEQLTNYIHGSQYYTGGRKNASA